MSDIHKKAIRLIEGGHVMADSLWVRLVKVPCDYDSCLICEMDCLCHEGNEICSLCCECEAITHECCYLKLVNQKS